MPPTSHNPTLEDLFYRAIKIEESAAELYRVLESRFAHHAESADLWRVLAADEDIHAHVLTEALGDASATHLATGAPAEVWQNVSAILQFIESRRLDEIHTLADAFDLAYELEHSEVNSVFEFLSVDAIPGKVERAFIRNHIVAHQERLADFRKAYGDLDWLRITAT